ncbi:hypothetical protein ABE485_10050 [Achromobacter spanius]|uniref:hypothetical protein n=1 Tax=Achromobacter spanius TaxID=217203 RepID=UPI003207FC35
MKRFHVHLHVDDLGETSCCYARSEKYWITDPQGLAWEHFHTLDAIPVYGELHSAQVNQVAAPGCCSPSIKAEMPTGCCTPKANFTTRCC